MIIVAVDRIGDSIELRIADVGEAIRFSFWLICPVRLELLVIVALAAGHIHIHLVLNIL